MQRGRGLLLLGLAAAIVFLLGVATDMYTLRLVVKPIPVLTLALAVRRFGSRPYAGWITAGLLVSAVGDVLMEVSDDTFLLGVGAFLLAHLAYITAFVGAAPRRRLLWAIPFVAWGFGLVWWLRGGLADAGMLVPVAVYAAVICTMMWRATARLGDAGLGHASPAGVFACVGALLFAVSDSLIAIERFGGMEVPFARYAIMLLYWFGQLGIAASALHEPAS